MTRAKKKLSEPIAEVRVDGEIGDTEQVRPRSAGLWRLLGEVVAMLPAYRDSRQGRATSKQVRTALLVMGLVLMAFGGQAARAPALWIVAGVAIASSVFVLPVRELKKRGWRTRIAKKQRPRRRRKWRPGAVAIHEGRLELEIDGQRVRRIRLDRGKHQWVVRRRGDWTCLGVLAPGAKKEGTIWVCTEGEVAAVESDEPLGGEQMELPARVTATDWERLWDVLEQLD